ncbi:MAG: DUF1092 family protein [Synechococcales cyanobacterium CRU_2_2]|nr:DUF1092 family protein [Synechococcales cyanobacterium CRU_2_2]
MATIWELDFYSRPIVQDNGKKLWEVVICETPLVAGSDPADGFRFAKYCPSSSVNSAWLKEALEEAIAQAPAPPTLIRFFRRQMNNMILKASSDAGLQAKASRRITALSAWLDQRYAETYPQSPGYQASPNPSVQYLPDPALVLPDALEGERWAFVNLTAADFAEMGEWEIGFGEAFSLKGLVPPEQKIPGMLIFSRRANPLAAWLSGLELAYLKFDGGPPTSMVLETGVSDRWLLAAVNNKATIEEAKAFEAAKAAANNVHFIGIQSNPEEETFAGFWLLKELQLG